MQRMSIDRHFVRFRLVVEFHRSNPAAMIARPIDTRYRRHVIVARRAETRCLT